MPECLPTEKSAGTLFLSVQDRPVASPLAELPIQIQVFSSAESAPAALAPPSELFVAALPAPPDRPAHGAV